MRRCARKPEHLNLRKLLFKARLFNPEKQIAVLLRKARPPLPQPTAAPVKKYQIGKRLDGAAPNYSRGVPNGGQTP